MKSCYFTYVSYNRVNSISKAYEIKVFLSTVIDIAFFKKTILTHNQKRVYSRKSMKRMAKIDMHTKTNNIRMVRGIGVGAAAPPKKKQRKEGKIEIILKNQRNKQSIMWNFEMDKIGQSMGPLIVKEEILK